MEIGSRATVSGFTSAMSAWHPIRLKHLNFRPTSSLVESEELDSCLVIDEIGPQSSTASETDSMRIDGSPRPDSDIEIIATNETEHEE